MLMLRFDFFLARMPQLGGESFEYKSDTSQNNGHFLTFPRIHLFAIMPSGNGAGFEGAQRDFLKNLIPGFLAKTAYREPASMGKQLLEDDPDLSKWVAARRDEFEAKFSLDIINNQDNQKSNQKIREVWFQIYI